MMLVQCNSNVPISQACSVSRGNSPDHGIIGTASLGGPRRPAVSRATGGDSVRQATFGVEPLERNSASSTHIRCRMTPIRRANATIARFDPRRRATCAAQVLSHVARPRCIMTVAAWHRARRRLTSPALVIPPETSRSPDWLREGVRPAHGPIFFEDVNRPGSSTADRSVSATTAPTPGTNIMRRHAGKHDTL